MELTGPSHEQTFPCQTGCAWLRAVEVGAHKAGTLAFGRGPVSSAQVWGVPFSLKSPFPASPTVGVAAGRSVCETCRWTTLFSETSGEWAERADELFLGLSLWPERV